MRRFQTLLIAAGLAATPITSAADPCPPSGESSLSYESSAKPRLGVLVMSLTPELRKHFGTSDDRGVLVARVEPLSAAAATGIRAGDLITEVRGKAVDDAGDVAALVAEVPKGQALTVKLIRDKKPMELSVRPSSNVNSVLDAFPGLDWLRSLMATQRQST